MGWSFSWDPSYDRAALIEDLQKPERLSPGYAMLKHRVVGNHHWFLYRTPEGKKTIGLNLMAGGGGRRGKDKMGWGYKGLSESMGISELDCPLSLLNEADEPESYAVEWREKVREYHAAKKQRASIRKPGAQVRIYKRTFTLDQDLGRKGWNVRDEQGGLFRINAKTMAMVAYL